MKPAELIALAPLLIVAGSALVVMLAIAVHRNHLLTAALTIGGLTLALFSLPILAPLLPQRVTTLLIADRYAFFYMGLIFAATLATAFFAYGYLEKSAAAPEEFYLLLLLAATGAAVLVASSHFASLFLGLETLSVSLYGLVAYLRSREQGLEGALKYLVLAALSSAFLLFGMALLYAEFGTLEFGALAEQVTRAPGTNILLLAGTTLLITGLGFKLALVPFHMWAADVYEGAPLPVTAFIATVSKGAVFALLLRYFRTATLPPEGAFFLLFSIIALVSMFVGNLLALFQENVKRLLAYSSIAHLGYLLVAFLANGLLATTTVTFYLTTYFVTLYGAFGVMSLLSDGGGEADTLAHYRSLAWHRPWVAGVLTAMLLSLAGIPLTAGFLGKFTVLAAGVASSLWTLTIALVLNSALGLFYYLRLILVIFAPPEETPGEERSRLPAISPAGHLVLAVLLLLLLWLGLFPGPILELLSTLAIGP